MLRSIMLLLPWLFLGGCTSLFVGASRVPEVMTIGFEQVFQDLWEPVAVSGLAVAGICLFPTIAVLVYRVRDEDAKAALVGTGLHPAAVLVLLGAVAVAYVSHVAHEEAVRRSNESHAEFMADLHDDVRPAPGPLRFDQDWRRTARLSLTLYLVSSALYGGWIVLRAWLAVRRRRLEERSLVEPFS